jgi:hypothetical protein
MHTAPSKSITVAEAADKWINGVGADGRERSTIEQYRQHAKIHILPQLIRQTGEPDGHKGRRVSRRSASEIVRPLAAGDGVAQAVIEGQQYGHVADEFPSTDKPQRKLEAGRDLPTPAEVKRMVAVARAPRSRACTAGGVDRPTL